jgi:hypothetical protein
LCRSNAVFWPPHGFAGIVIDKILPAIFTTLHSGVNSVWATVFGRLLSIACGNIVPFKVREPAFAGFLSICSCASSLIRRSEFQPHTIRFLHRSNLFRVISGALEFIQSSFSAHVPCILVCVLCVRLPTCGFLVRSAALEPLFGSSTLDSSR